MLASKWGYCGEKKAARRKLRLVAHSLILGERSILDKVQNAGRDVVCHNCLWETLGTGQRKHLT